MKRKLMIGISITVVAVIFLVMLFSQQGSMPPEPSATPTVETIRPTPTPSPAPTPHNMSWDETHRLDTDWRPDGTNGLELPVRGATGFASVRLGLYADQPQNTMPIPTPTPAPTPTPLPTAIPPETAVPTPAISTTPLPTAVPEPPAPVQVSPSVPPESDAPAVNETVAPDLVDVPAVGESTTPTSSAEPVLTPLPAISVPPQTPVPSTAPAVTDSPLTEPLPAATPELEPTPTPTPDPFAGAMAVLEPGTPFVILQESGFWWLVRCAQGVGWVEHRYCMINLPDVIPSMVFDATNSYQSMYICCGKEIPGVTGASFYPGKQPNERLGQDQFIMPILYASAKKVNQAQQAALSQGNTLLLREAYRPNSTQLAVVNGMNALIRQDPEVKQAITAPPWSLTWFINTSTSNHQRGFAVDITMAKAFETERRTTGNLEYLVVTDYEEYQMTSVFHELSPQSATFTGPVASHSKTAWKSAALDADMNAPALALQHYFVNAGFTPLASEWWHFNDLDTRLSVLHNLCSGNFQADTCLSTAP